MKYQIEFKQGNKNLIKHVNATSMKAAEHWIEFLYPNCEITGIIEL